MPLVDAQAIVFLFPLIVVCLSALFLKERITSRVAVAATLGFCGVLLVVRPGGGAVGLAPFLVLGAALATAGYMVLNRALADGRSEAFLILAPPAFAALVLAGLQPSVWVVPAATDWPLFIGIGVFNAIAHAMILLAHSRTEANQLAPLSYLQVVTGALLGYLVFADVPGWATLSGLVLIVTGGMLVHRRHIRAIGVGATMR